MLKMELPGRRKKGIPQRRHSRREGKSQGEKEAADVATDKSNTQKRKKKEDNMMIDCILDRQRIFSFRTNLTNLFKGNTIWFYYLKARFRIIFTIH